MPTLRLQPLRWPLRYTAAVGLALAWPTLTFLANVDFAAMRNLLIMNSRVVCSLHCISRFSAAPSLAIASQLLLGSHKLHDNINLKNPLHEPTNPRTSHRRRLCSMLVPLHDLLIVHACATICLAFMRVVSFACSCVASQVGRHEVKYTCNERTWS